MNRKLLLFVPIIVAIILLGSALTVSAGQEPGRPDTSPVVGQLQQGQPANPLAPVGSGFTYQGRLTTSGNPANGQYDLQFSLFDAASGGIKVGNTFTVLSQTVSSGLFTVQLDFGASVFQGDARWLEIEVRQAGGGAYTTLAPRQPLTAAPYALSLMPGAVIATSSYTSALSSWNSLGTGLYGYSTGQSGVYGQSGTGYGVYGYTGGSISSAQQAGVYGGNGSNGPGVHGFSQNGYGVYGLGNSSGTYGNSTSGYGAVGSSTNSYGVYGESATNTGIFGTGSNRGVHGQSTAADGWGVYGESNTGAGARGVYGKSGSGTGVWGLSTANNGTGLYGEANTGINANGVAGTSSTGIGVYGLSTASNRWGVYGEANTGTDARGVYGASSTGTGVYGSSAGTNKWGVYGEANSGSFASGVYGQSYSGSGVYGVAWASNGIGIIGEANSTNAIGVDARSDFGTAIYARGGTWAGYFQGNVYVSGTINKSAVGFKIDHPDDPANKYLYHSSVESQDMKDLYDGMAVLDARGETLVELPSWFQSVNGDFRYQLTCIGDYAPVYIAQEISNNRFKIAGGKAGMKVSWQVTGIRHDPYAEQNRMPVEQDKPENERGYYLHPELYGQPDSKRMDKALLLDGSGALPASPPHGK